MALVAMGAVACAESDPSVDNDVQAGLSFYAEIATDATRANLEYDENDGLWKTVWEGNEELKVFDINYTMSFIFKNSPEAPNKFTCLDSGVQALVGEQVIISDTETLLSSDGKKAWNVYTYVDNFLEEECIALETQISYLRYTYNGSGSLTLSLTNATPEDDSFTSPFWLENMTFSTEITFNGIQGENWVAVVPGTGEDGRSALLSYTIDGVVCKQTVIENFKWGKVYNLGELAIPYDESDTWGITGAFSGWDVANAKPLYVVGDVLVAYNLTNLNDGFKFVQNRGWDGAKGSKTLDAVASGEWLYSGENDIKTSDAAAYDVYFVPERSMYCIVAAGSPAPELPVVEPIEWSLAGSFNGWTDKLMTATDTANLFVAKGVELKSGDEIKVKDSKTWDTSYGGGINNLEANKWMKAYFNGSNVVVAKSGSYDVYFEYAEGAEYSKLYLVEAEADYTAAVEQTANGTLVPDGGDEPEEVVPGEASEWALVGVFSSWADKTMKTTTKANVVVLEGVDIKAAEGFLVRKPSTDWADKYGAGNVNYIKANHYITTSKDGADMCLEADGTYDIYFNVSTKNLYVMTAGTDYATATKQTVNGEEPKQEEPEVTEKVVYLKPNSNWTQSNARFAAYFFGGSVGEKWVSMTACGDGTYEVHLPEGYDYGCNIIFCRMNPSTTANNWNNKWNQTADLKTPTDGKNLYTVKAGTWDKGGGEWSVK